MPTLEETAVDFPVTTLNDLLEVEAKAGVTVGADEDKYRRWAFISTAAAGLLAIALLVVLVTDSGGGNGDSTAKAKDYADVGKPVKQTVKLATNVTSDIQVGKEVGLYKGSDLVAAPVIVSQIINPKSGSLETAQSVELAMDEAQSAAFVKAFPKASDKGRLQIFLPGQPTAPASPPAATPDSTAPATTTESTAPAATPDTTPASTPPASG
jgi:hypothetical protein